MTEVGKRTIAHFDLFIIWLFLTLPCSLLLLQTPAIVSLFSSMFRLKKNSFLFAISIYVRLLPLSLSKVFLKIHFGPDAWTNRQAAVNSYLRHKRNKTAHSVLVKQ